MPKAVGIAIGQSEAGFFTTLGGGAVYVETGLASFFPARTGREQLEIEVERRLPGWTWSNQGGLSSPVTMIGGTSLQSMVIDARIAPGDDTPITSNTDPRLNPIRGQVYSASIDSIISAQNPTTDAWILYRFRQTFEADDPDGWVFDNTVYARAITLLYNFWGSKFAATGKPWHIIEVQPGNTGHGNSGFRANYARMRAITSHLAGVRMNAVAGLTSFAPISNFHIASPTIDNAMFANAQQADNVAVGSDFLHQSAGSSRRTAKQLAVKIAKLLEPGTAQEFDGPPTISAVTRVAGEPNKVRVVVKITPGNTLQWQGPDPSETGTVNQNNGTTANPDLAHFIVHQTPYAGTTVPAQQTIVSAAVTPGAPSGFAWFDITLAAPVPATCYYTQETANQSGIIYTRRAEAISPALKIKTGLREVNNPSLVMNADMADLKDFPDDAALFVLGATNILIGDLNVSSFSDYAENLIARAILGTPGTRPTAWHLAVGTGFNDAAGLTGQIGSRVSTGPWNVTGRVASNPTAAAFGSTTGATFWAVYDAPTGGNPIAGGAITAGAGTLPINAGAFTITFNGDYSNYAANLALQWLMTAGVVTLPTSRFGAIGTGGSAAGVTGEIGTRPAVSPSVSASVATIAGAITISIAGDVGSPSVVGIYDAVSGGNLLAWSTRAAITTGAAGTVSAAGGITITVD
jgi:hypothetical protein